MSQGATADKLRVHVVDRVATLWQGHANHVSVPAVDGRLGILAGRQPILAALESGVVEINPSNAPAVKVQIDEGFVSVDSNFINIVVEGGSLVEGE